MKKIILETERLFLREMDMDDYDALYDVLGDPEIMQHYPYTFNEEKVRDCQHKGYAKEAAAAVRDWAFENTDYPAIYSYCKYTNEASYKTAESIGMHFEKEYPDEENKITRVSVIYRNDL